MDSTAVAIVQSRFQKSLHHTLDRSVTHMVSARHSTRAFLSTAVPHCIIEDALSMAQRAPSSTNIQPWQLHFATGPTLERIRTSLVKSFENGEPLKVPPIPAGYAQYRTQLGKEMYGPNGFNIPPDDAESHHQTVKENFRFYEAPLVAVASIDRSLNTADIVSVGMYLQTLALLLTERGLGTCFEVSTVGYPEIIRKELGIEEEMDLLCSLAIGYEDKSQQINKLNMSRRSWKENVQFVG